MKTTTLENALIENNKLVSDRLKKLWNEKVNKAPSDDDPTREKVLSDFNFDKDRRYKLDFGLEQTITDTINALDVTDTANERKYVASVNEVDGKIIVERAEHLGGIKPLLNAEITEKDPYNTKFLYTTKEGRLVYYSLTSVREGQEVKLASAAQLCTQEAMRHFNEDLDIPTDGVLIIGNNTDYNYLEISHGNASDSIIIKYFVEGNLESEFSSETGAWTHGVPTLTLTASILGQIDRTKLDINKFVSPQTTFNHKVTLLREADVTDDYLDEKHPTPAEKCMLVSRKGVEDAINKVEDNINDLRRRLLEVESRLGERLKVLETGHSIEATQGSSLFALDADGKLINAAVVDENGNEVPVEVVK